MAGGTYWQLPGRAGPFGEVDGAVFAHDWAGESLGVTMEQQL